MIIQAYRRENGEIGIRNHLLVMSASVCANDVTSRVAAQLNGAIPVIHKNGCGEADVEDREFVRRTLSGLGASPNVGACIVIGLGCEDTKAKFIAEEVIKTGKPVEYFEIQEVGGSSDAIAKGVEIGQKMLRLLSDMKRVECDLSEVILGLECGGSDTFSGITANPALGRACDMLVAEGGSAIIGETIEHFGGEQILMERMVTDELRQQFREIIAAWDRLQAENNVPYNYISIGNMEGGLSTLEEKALGCVLKAGSSPIIDIVDYSVKPEKRGGVIIMDATSTDIESMTGKAAGGAHLICFTTGRGTPTACPISPTIKICSNNITFEKMKENMDINAGTCLTGESDIDQVGKEIFEEIVAVCNGKLTKAEILGFGGFAIQTRHFTY